MPAANDEWSRRRLLRTGSGTLAAGGLAAVAGCQSGLPPLSGSVEFGRLDAPEPGEPRYAQWVPDPSAIAAEEHGTSEDHNHVWYAEPRRLSGSVYGASALPMALTTSRLDYFGVGYRNYEWAVAMLDAGVVVCQGGVDRSTVADAVAGTGYESRDSYRGYDVYSRSDHPRTVAVDDTTLVFGESDADVPSHATRNVETVIDARAGDAPRRVDTDATFATLVDRAGSRPGTWLGLRELMNGADETPLPANEKLFVAAIAWDLDAEGVPYHVWDLVYEAGTTAPERAIKRRLEQQQRALNASLVDVEIDGRFARVEMRQPREEIRSRQSDESNGPPQITWGTDYDRQNQTVTIHNEAGESADPSTLSIEGNPGKGGPGNTDWQSAFAEFDTFEPGDSVTLSTEGVEWGVRIVYSAPDDSMTSTLFSYELPDTDSDRTATTTGTETTAGDG